MPLTTTFKNEMAKGNILGMRIMMKDSLLVDRTFVAFDEMEEATREVLGLYDDHDERELNEDKETWTEEYMNKLMVQIVGNFSHDRIEHLKAVVMYLRPVVKPIPKIAPSPEPKKEEQANKTLPQKLNTNHKFSGRRQTKNNERFVKIVIGVAAGAVVGGALISAVGGSALVGSVIGGATGGVVAAKTNKK